MKAKPLTTKQKRHIRIGLNLLITTIEIRAASAKTDALKLPLKKRIRLLTKLTKHPLFR